MRKDLHTMPASGLRVRDIGMKIQTVSLSSKRMLAEARMEQTDVKGFPIVSADDKRVLLGYIGRGELRYVVGMCSYIFISNYY